MNLWGKCYYYYPHLQRNWSIEILCDIVNKWQNQGFKLKQSGFRVLTLKSSSNYSLLSWKHFFPSNTHPTSGPGSKVSSFLPLLYFSSKIPSLVELHYLLFPYLNLSNWILLGKNHTTKLTTLWETQTSNRCSMQFWSTVSLVSLPAWQDHLKTSQNSSTTFPPLLLKIKLQI